MAVACYRAAAVRQSSQEGAGNFQTHLYLQWQEGAGDWGVGSPDSGGWGWNIHPRGADQGGEEEVGRGHRQGVEALVGASPKGEGWVGEAFQVGGDQRGV